MCAKVQEARGTTQGWGDRDVDPLVIDTVRRWVVNRAVVLVYFSMSPQVGHDREMASATLYFAGKWLLSSVAVHVRL